MSTTIEICDCRPVQLVSALTELWEQSVRASHHFLNESNISNLRPVVEQALKEIPVLAVARYGNEIAGFIGVAEKKIEMLFVRPSYFGNGIGRSFLDWAINNYNVEYIDVNEQNEKAASIYLHWGFKVYERTELDDYGNPFPILKMRLLK